MLVIDEALRRNRPAMEVSSAKMTTALLDRLTHRATILEFVGTSFRFRQQLQRQEQETQVPPEVVQVEEAEAL